MNSDLPLNNKKEDKLGRHAFAEEIANGLVNSFKDNHESLVIGINGAWGSGKSTLINFILKEVEHISLEQEESIIVLSFNPWMFSGQKELQNIFLKELYLKFESQKEKLAKASKKLADFLSHLNWLKYIHSGAGEAVNDAKSFLEGLSKEKDLYQLKSDIDKILIESKVKLYISIDDIDRLTPTEITDIFQLVKLNGNFANTVFLLAYDREVVTNALEKQFGGSGKKYIEKIVQVDYTLPNISRQDIERIFVDSLNQSFSNSEVKKFLNDSFEEIGNESFIRLFNSLRDVYRFNNSLKLRLPSIFNELNIREFFLVESLRIFRPDAYDFLIKAKDKLIYKDESNTIYTTRSVKNEESQIEFIGKQDFDPITKDIIKDLFVLDGNNTFYHTSTEDLIREKRIANPNYFDRYFNLQLSNFDIQESVFDEFINNPIIQRKTFILEHLLEGNRLFQFLNWVEIKSRNTAIENIKSIIFACFKFSDSIHYTRETFHSMTSNFLEVQRFCSRMLSRIKTAKERREVIEKHITDNEKPLYFSSFYTINGILQAKYLLDKGELSSNHMWYPLFSDDLKDNTEFERQLINFYRKATKKVFIKYSKNLDFLNGYELISLLPELKRYHSKFYDREFNKLIGDDNKLLEILILCITKSYRTSGSAVGYQLTKYQLLPGMEVEGLKNRLEKMSLNNFDKEKAAAIKFYLKAYEDKFPENQYYNFYTLESVGRF